MRVAIIGAGAAGLTSAKNAKEKGMDCVVFEQWSEVGGVWVYTDYTDFDQYGYPVLSAMYAGLVTNLPKEVMAFSDFPAPKQPKSYLNQQETLNYLKSYADHFNLKSLIKLNTIVTLLKPLAGGSKWEISTENKRSKTKSVDIFDAVMICTGNYHTPNTPTIPGMELFRGEQIHSKMYRKVDKYKGKVVLIIGGGVSGIDILSQISSVAKQVIFNYRSVIIRRTYPENVIIKECEIKFIQEHSVTFVDGSNINIDCIIYCTGYYYDYPFLHESCEITGGDFVQPLYKHMININYPTMAFIGLPAYTSLFVTFDLQARFFINYLLGIASLPSKEQMSKDLELDIEERTPNGLIGKKFHRFDYCYETYCNDLALLGKTENVPKVIHAIFKAAVERCFDGCLEFQKDIYQIVDNNNFIRKIPE